MFLYLIVILSICLFYYLYKKLYYLQSIGIPTLPNTNIIFGDILNTILGRKHVGIIFKDAYDYFQSKGYKYGGVYLMTKPAILIVDPKLYKSIYITDFEHWSNRGMYADPINDPLSGHIFSLEGEEWKYVRKNLSPAFTSGKLKGMFQLMVPHIDTLCHVIALSAKDNLALDIYKTLEKLGIDIIGHVALGVECNTLENQNQDLANMANRIFHPRIWHILDATIREKGNFMRGITRPITADKTMCSYFLNLMNSTKIYREAHNQDKYKDFFQCLLDLTKTDNKPLTFNQIAAQAFAFFIAAFETSAKTVHMALYELAKDANLQQKLRTELKESLKNPNGVLNYESISSNTLLDMIVKETLRKHNPVIYIPRVCTKTYRIPDTSIVLKKGTYLVIPTYGLHMSTKNFPKPEKFDPFRFSDTNKDNIEPFTYAPFGYGPRNCIGLRFALMQVKLTLAKLIQNFEVTVSPKTKEPLEISTITWNNFLNYKHEIYYHFKKL